MRTPSRRLSWLQALPLAALALARAAAAHDVAPLSLTIPVGGTGTYTVSDPACRAQILSTPADPTIVSVSPGGVVTAFSQTYTVQGLKAGTTTILVDWNGVSPCVDVGSRVVTVTVTPVVPTPTPTPGPGGGSLRVSPDTIAEGTRNARLTIAGSGFTPATNVTTSADIRIESVNVLASDRIELLVSNAPGTPSGPRVFLVMTPGGGVGQVVVTVIPSASIAAPLAVTTAAVVYPRPGAFLEPGDALFARGILATAGTGVVLGSWRLDGFPYERFAVTAAGGDPVVLSSRLPIPAAALGDHELTLTVDHPQDLVSEPVRLLVVPHREDGFRLLEPLASPPGPPLFRWTPVPGIEGYLVEWSADGSDDDLVLFRVGENEWRPTEGEWQAVGARRLWAVRPIFPVDVRGERSAWRRFAEASAGRDARRAAFVRQTSPPQPSPGQQLQQPHASGAAPLPGAAAVGEVRVDATAFVTGVETSDALTTPSTAHLALSSAGAWRDGPFSVDETETLAGHHELDAPHRTVQDGRNFIVQGAWHEGVWGAGARASYGTPSMSDQLQLLTTGLARGGVELWTATPYGKLSAYESFDGAPPGTISSVLGEQRVRFAGYDAPLPSDRFALRAVYLDADDSGSSDGLVPAMRRRAFGALGRWTLSPAFMVVLEAAHGSGDTAPGATESTGNAFRLGLSGLVSGWRWGVSLHRVDGSYMNPANRGLTTASRDRTSGEATLARAFGRLGVSLLYRYYESGSTPGTNDPKGRQHSGALSFALPLSPKLTLSGTGILTQDKADAGLGATGALPGADRLQSGVSLAASEVLGRLAFAETLAYTKVSDRISSVNDTSATTASVSASGAITARLSLASALSYTRLVTELGGAAETWVLFVQPAFALPAHLSFTPRAGFVHTEAGATGLATQSEQYLGNVQWASSVGSGFGIGLGATAEWDRTRASTGTSSGFLHRLSASVAIRWGAVARGQGAPRAELPPVRAEGSRASLR